MPQVLGDLTIVGQGADATILELAQANGERFRLFLAFSSRFELEPLTQADEAGGFLPAEVDPRLARSIAVRT